MKSECTLLRFHFVGQSLRNVTCVINPVHFYCKVNLPCVGVPRRYSKSTPFKITIVDRFLNFVFVKLNNNFSLQTLHRIRFFKDMFQTTFVVLPGLHFKTGYTQRLPSLSVNSYSELGLRIDFNFKSFKIEVS